MLPADEAAHLRTVLRLVPGDEVGIFDGRGREAVGRVAAVGKGDVVIDQVAVVPAAPEPPVALTVALGVLKGDAMDHAIRDATVLGAGTIAPIVTARVIGGVARRRSTPADRWRRVALAAAKQCGRAVVPQIEPVADLASVLSAADSGPVIYGAEPGAGNAIDAAALGPAPSRALLLIGPEGGWAKEELAMLTSHGAIGLRAGPRTLRAELAVVVMVSVIWEQWGWQGQAE